METKHNRPIGLNMKETSEPSSEISIGRENRTSLLFSLSVKFNKLGTNENDQVAMFSLFSSGKFLSPKRNS